MSGMYPLTSVVLALFSALDILSMVKAEICHSGLECDYHEYCCGEGCCSSDNNYGYNSYGYGFYNLWYFWFVIIMIMMTCCGACSYVKKRQYYIRQQQALGANLAGTGNVHQQPPSMCVHPSNAPVGPPVGTFPGPPAYTEVTDKPHQYPKADFVYPNYGFAAPPYSPPVPGAVPQAPAATAMPTPPTDGAAQLPYPTASAHNAPPLTGDAVPTSAPPPYTPAPTSPASATPTDPATENA